MIKKAHLRFTLMFLFALASVRFYSPATVDIRVLNGSYYILFSVVFVCSWREFFKPAKFTSNAYLVKILLIAILFSILMAMLVWSQGFIPSLKATMPYLAFLFLFFLIGNKPSVFEVERVIILVGIGFIICYLYALYRAPVVIFAGSDHEINDDRGFFRLFISGSSFLYLLFFMGISKYSFTKKPLWLIASLVLFILIVLQVTRQYIVIAACLSLLYLLKNMNWAKKLAVLVGLSLIITFSFAEFTILKNLKTLTESQIQDSSNSDSNIRVKAYKFFIFDFPPSVPAAIFGSGVPRADGSSAYGTYYKYHLNKSEKLYFADVGYAAIYAQFGIISLLIFIVLVFRIFGMAYSYEVGYAKMFLIFSFLANIASDFAIAGSNIIPICFCLYLLMNRSMFRPSRQIINSLRSLPKLV